MIRLTEIVMLALLLFGILPAMVMAHDTRASTLDPICHQYYEMIQSPDLTYEDVGRIAEAMYHKQCWPGLHGETPPLVQTACGLPSCEYLAEQLVNGSTNIRKLFDVRPMVGEDCGELHSSCRYPGHADNDYCTREHGNSVILIADKGLHTQYLALAQCDLLVDNPALVADQRPDFGFRPVNCRGKILYADGSKSGFYFYMEQYSDGDSGVWGANIPAWRW